MPINLKELISDFGGGRLLSLIAVIGVLVHIGVDRYVDSIETRLAASAREDSVLAARLTAIEHQLVRVEQWRGQGERFTAEDGRELRRELERRIERLEQR